MCVYLKNSTKKLLEKINNFGKVVGKINLEKSIAFFIHQRYTWKEIMDTLIITIASKKISYQEINITREEKNLRGNNLKVLKNDIEKDTKKWKDLP